MLINSSCFNLSNNSSRTLIGRNEESPLFGLVGCLELTHTFKKRHSEQLRCFGAIARHPKWLQRFDRMQPSRTARSVPGMSRCTVPEKPIRSGLEYTDKFAFPDQLRASDQITYWKQHGADQHTDPPLSADHHSLRGQLSFRWSTQLDGQLILRWSTQLATVNSAWGLNTAYDLKQLTI
ncbi:ABC transporter D family member 2, chloroplastic [Dorcoceras hygrometricum]|uniref:ABC transporter D family member 2, chloroplastic n=1 Tax=Dorcoceras hygrometricum TaxID=472368 RepID=A0A2Z7ACE9_9LAMI|nr:ABC transporter D family member 2, chloroplastic [Dorcoceras hygrometricum]